MPRGRRDHQDPDDRTGRLSDKELARLVLDDAFVQAAAVKEPPAAERDGGGPLVAPPRPPRLRLAPPPGTRAPFAWLRQRAATIVVVVLVAGMLAGSVGPFASRRTEDSAGDEHDEPVAPRARTSPFAGTPAQQFADGSAGLVLPAARTVGDLQTADVALALYSVRRATLAANIEATVLTGSSHAAYLDAVGPDTRQRLEQADVHGGAAMLGFVTRFPDGVVLAATPPKVSGTFTYEADGTDAVRIEGRHVFAYPARRANDDDGAPAESAPGADAVEVLAIRRDTTWRVARAPDGTTMGKPELLTSAVATSGHCLAEPDGTVWPRFTTPPGAVRAGSAVPVQWNVAEPLISGIDCFLPTGARHT